MLEAAEMMVKFSTGMIVFGLVGLICQPCRDNKDRYDLVQSISLTLAGYGTLLFAVVYLAAWLLGH